MTDTRAFRVFLGLLVIVAAVATSATAQTNDEVFPQFQWNFATPGARANAMGRAFIAVADDASAAVTNPAGLVSLTRPQVYLEFKNTNLRVDRFAATNSYFTGGTQQFGDMTNSLSFFDISVPLLNNRVAVGFTRHEFLNYKESFDLQARSIPDPQGVLGRTCATATAATCFSTYPEDATTNFNGVSYGFSAAYAVNKMIRVGVTIYHDTLNAQTSAKRSALQNQTIIVDQASISSNKSGNSVTVGALFRPNEIFTVGVSYSSGPKFGLTENYAFNIGDCFDFNGMAGCTGKTPTNQPLQNYTDAAFANGTGVTINVPNRFGFGVAVRPRPQLVVALDAVRINYSRLAQDFTVIFFYKKLDNTLDVLPSNFTIADVTEVHVGAEYNVASVANKYPLFVRAGVFTNPDHRLKYVPSASASQAANFEENLFFNTGSRNTVVKGTLGAGLVIGSRLQLDAAYVFKQDFIVSAGVRF